jgi:DNA-binding MarR family transcriptional regulator
MDKFRVTRTLNTLVSKLNSSADEILRKEFRITYSQFRYLLVVNENPDISLGKLAKALSISQPAVSKKISEFLEQGLMTSARDPEHKTKVVLRTTSKGKRLSEQASSELEARFVNKLNFFQPGELEKFEGSLQVMLKKLSEKG